jgi:hypothetical protein
MIYVSCQNVRASIPPLPFGERAFRRDLARDATSRRLRKSRGGKGEGAKASEIRTARNPFTRKRSRDATSLATSPRRGEV